MPLGLPVVLLGLGLGYAVLCLLAGPVLPCPFHTLTGLLCPGCGVTRMCLSLVRLDFRGAWGYNPVLMLALPFVAVLLARDTQRRMRRERTGPARWETNLGWGVTICLVIWGIARNLI